MALLAYHKRMEHESILRMAGSLRLSSRQLRLWSYRGDIALSSIPGGWRIEIIRGSSAAAHRLTSKVNPGALCLRRRIYQPLAVEG